MRWPGAGEAATNTPSTASHRTSAWRRRPRSHAPTNAYAARPPAAGPVVGAPFVGGADRSAQQVFCWRHKTNPVGGLCGTASCPRMRVPGGVHASIYTAAASCKSRRRCGKSRRRCGLPFLPIRFPIWRSSGTRWRWETDDPQFLVDGFVDGHQKMVNVMKVTSCCSLYGTYHVVLRWPTDESV
jgi:hypothetical protein